ncbi:MAG: PilX N-terminal domain-containing pilus assembly protein [Candidatus Sedimenticola sp. 20ELBAFRAG]
MRTSAEINSRQQGAVLLTGLMILLLLTILGISSMGTNIVQERMAANMHDRNIALQAAESALRRGEMWIAAMTTIPEIGSNTNSNGKTIRIWDLTEPDWPGDGTQDDGNNTYWWQENDVVWWYTPGNGVLNEGADELDGVAIQPAYIIEKLPPRTVSLEGGEPVDDADIFLQVTARGVGGSPTALVQLQTIYKW